MPGTLSTNVHNGSSAVSHEEKILGQMRTAASILGLNAYFPVQQADIKKYAPIPLRLDMVGDILYVGPEWTELTGFLAEKTQGQSLSNFLPAQAVAYFERWLSAAFASGDGVYCLNSLPLLTSDKLTRWISVALTVDGVSRTASGQVEDKTSFFKSDQIKSIMSTMMDLTVNGVVITDALMPGNPIIAVNAGFTRLTGFTADEVVGMSCGFLQRGERDQPDAIALRQAIRQQKAITVNLKNFRKNGQVFWNQLTVTPIRHGEFDLVTHFIGVQTDVTQERETLFSLSTRSAELDALLQASTTGLLTFDTDDRVCLFNPAFQRLTGIDASGKSFSSIMDELQAIADAQYPCDRHMLETQPVVHLHVTTPQPKILEITRGVHNRTGRERVLNFRDVTSEVMISQMKTQFLNSAAHELRSPLSSILGFAELMLMRDYSAEKMRDMLQVLLRQSKRMASLLDDLLDLSRIEAQEVGVIPLRGVDVLEAVRMAVEALNIPDTGVSIHVRLLSAKTPAPVMALANPAKLEQVLINLLSNAVKYSGGRREVEVALHAEPLKERVGIAVRDHGIGMSSDTLGKLFTRFFRADPEGHIPGTGLGLCITKELVHRMGGSIQVSSELGVGSEFVVWLKSAS